MDDAQFRDALDGPTLRGLRLAAGLSLRRVAAAGKLSHGHLSLVELGRRPVTPSALNAYRKAIGDRAGRSSPSTFAAPDSEDVPVIGGPTLRRIRMSKGMSICSVARAGNQGHSNLSKVERCERRVTPAILQAYVRAGVVKPGDWRAEPVPERMSASRAAVAAAGGVPKDPLDWNDPAQMRTWLLARGRVPATSIDEATLAALATIAHDLTALDGVMPGHIAGVLLDWTVCLPACADDTLDAGLYSVMAHLALRAGRAAVEQHEHEACRSLYAVALYAARRADEPDLAARVVSEIDRARRTPEA